MTKPAPVDPLQRELELEEAEGIEQARKGLLNFTLWTKPDYQVNWHHRILCQALNRIATGELKRLIVTMQPRVGKSELLSRRFPARLLGLNPRMRIIATSYADSLSSMMNRDVQRILETNAYRKLYPETRLRGDRLIPGTTSWLRNSGIFEVVGYGGSYRSAGIGGSLTGMGADVLLVDDYHKNQEEADSHTQRQKNWEWFASTALTRLERDAAVAITATRWHEDDLVGRLLALAESDPLADQWEVISFPAVAEGEPMPGEPREPGDALWPEKFDLQRLRSIKATVGSRVWTALYQQRPAPEGGTIVKRDWWRYYEAIPERLDVQIQSWDLTFTKSATSDFVSGQVWGRLGADRFLLDRIKERLSFTETVQAIKAMTRKWPQATAKYVEKAANGHALLDTLQREIPGLIGVAPIGSKVARANAVAPVIESGNVYLPHPKIAPWIGDFVEEWTAFPAGAHDDDVDACTQALLKLAERRAVDFVPMSIPKVNAFKY